MKIILRNTCDILNACDNVFRSYYSWCFFCIALNFKTINFLLVQHDVSTKLAFYFCFFSHSAWLAFWVYLSLLFANNVGIIYSFNNLLGFFKKLVLRGKWMFSRSSHTDVFCKNGVLRNFEKSTGYSVQSFVFCTKFCARVSFLIKLLALGLQLY